MIIDFIAERIKRLDCTQIAKDVLSEVRKETGDEFVMARINEIQDWDNAVLATFESFDG